MCCGRIEETVCACVPSYLPMQVRKNACHFPLQICTLSQWFTQQELLAAVLAAVVHDVEHTGTTNNFHVQSGSELALLYNDRSVLENHHVYYAYKHLTQEGMDIFKNLSQEDYRCVCVCVCVCVCACH